MEELIGRTLGQYEIKEKIGEGGMAFVFKAFQPSLNRFVAVKVLSQEVGKKKGFPERFQREAHSVARLNHPNILPVYDFGIQDGYSYIIMRYVEQSTTLGHLMAMDTPLDELIHYITQIADALNYAHKQKVIHRDVKPGNILIDGKWALLSDFGLVKINDETDDPSNQLTRTGLSMGTPAYMSPEQAEGITVDHRTDIYALGIILYKILTGSIPHDAPTPIGILVKRKSEPVPSLRQINPNISPGLEQVTLRALAMNPNKRYISATNFAEALKQAQMNSNYRENFDETSGPKEEMTLIARGSVPNEVDHTLPYPNSLRQTRGLVIGGAIAVLLMGGLIVFLLWLGRINNDKSLVQAEPQLKTNAISTPTPPRTPQAKVKTKLEVYSGPGDLYDLLGYLPKGTTVEITGQDETTQWWQIKTSLGSIGLGWIKTDPNFSQATNTQNVPIALASPIPTSTATAPLETPTPTATFTPESSTPTPTPPPSPTPSDGLITLTLWGSSVLNSLSGSGKEQWFTFNSGKEKDATLVVFIRNAEKIEIFLYQSQDIPSDPDSIPNFGIAAEGAINRDNDDRTKEFTWQGPITPNTRYYIRMINRGQAAISYCILTRPDRGSCP